MSFDVKELEQRSSELIETLVRVWECSVRATHAFLSEDDMVAMRPEVHGALASVERLAVVFANQNPVAFAGGMQGKLEMLFVAPEHCGQGVGHALLTHAIKQWDIHRLDVNEQNSQALAFYKHEGFSVAARSDNDDAGRPFPLLHLVRTSGIRTKMASGDWFDAADASLARDREHACSTIRRVNAALDLSNSERRELLCGLLGALGTGSAIAAGVQLDYGYHLFVGKGCYFNYNATFLDGAYITFGNDVWVGPCCTFATPLHPLLGRERAFRFDADGVSHLAERNLPITVGNDVWLAANVTVNPGVTIGDGAVIGSGSVVTKDVPAYTLAFGNPCRPIRAITENDSVAELLTEAGIA